MFLPSCACSCTSNGICVWPMKSKWRAQKPSRSCVHGLQSCKDCFMSLSFRECRPASEGSVLMPPWMSSPHFQPLYLLKCVTLWASERSSRKLCARSLSALCLVWGSFQPSPLCRHIQAKTILLNTRKRKHVLSVRFSKSNKSFSKLEFKFDE